MCFKLLSRSSSLLVAIHADIWFGSQGRRYGALQGVKGLLSRSTVGQLNTSKALHVYPFSHRSIWRIICLLLGNAMIDRVWLWMKVGMDGVRGGSAKVLHGMFLQQDRDIGSSYLAH